MSIGAFAIGSTAIQGRHQRRPSPPEKHLDPPGSVYVTVDGEVVEHLYRSIQIQKTLAGRSTMKFALKEQSNYRHWSVGERVEVRWNGYLFFAGTIEAADEEFEDFSPILFTKFSCVDWVQLCDRFYVTNSYAGMSLRSIVEDLVFNQTPLGEEGVTLGDIDEGPTITKATWNYRKLYDVFGDLAELSGLTWDITNEKKLIFYDQSTFVAPFTIGDSASLKYRDLTFKRTRSQYRNRELFRAGKDLTDSREETFRGDPGSTDPEDRRRTFTLAYPVGTTPIIIRRSADGSEHVQRVGIKGKDKDGDATNPNFAQWFFQFDEKEISQNSLRDEAINPTLSDAETLIARYKGLYPMVIWEQDDSEIAARAAIEGGTGLYEYVDEDDSIDGRDPAVEKALRLLQIYGRIPGELDYQTDLPGLEPGHLQTITLAGHGIAAIQYMIDSIQITFIDDVYPQFTVKALDGERQQGWSDFWRRLGEKGRKFVVRENEVAEKTFRPQDTITISDMLTDSVNGSVILPVYTEDPYTWARIGAVTVPVSGRRVPMAIVGRSRIGRPYGI